ncbi:MAG TPA: Mur ligase family protein [Streptosporangiaceae bacterium]|nr:Mur ligase family protein [Streptosporangiaceae bacterium]
MRLDNVRHLNGPNVFSATPVSVARLELGELTCRETTDYPGFAERLASALPGLRDHHCAAGRPGGFIEALARGTYFGHVTEHIALELSALAGREVHLGRTMWAGADGRYDVMTQCPQDEPEDSAVPRELIRLAMTVVKDLLAKQRPDLTAHLAAIARTVERERLGPSTAAIATAARRRGIPVRRVGGLSMLRLGYGCNRRLVSAAMTELTSALGTDIACDKMLAKEMLRRAGVAVPEGIVALSAAEAVQAVELLGAPVVIKPRNGNHGRYVTVGVRDPAEAEQAYRRACTGSGSAAAIVETYVPGTDYRVLVVDGRAIAAAELRPASVTGDGASTITDLVGELNTDPRRGDGHSRVLTKIAMDDAVLAHLAVSGLEPCSVPAAGQVVTLRRNGNLSTGGTSKDVTDQMHPDVADLCRRAAGAAGLDICGVDLRLADIGAPLFGAWHERGRPGDGAHGHGLHGDGRHGDVGPREGGDGSDGSQQDGAHGDNSDPAGAVIEINACPGLRMHLAPSEGSPRDVAGAIVDRLYPPGAPSRIPVIAVTGTNGKTTTVRMIAHILRHAGLCTGMSSTDGVYIGGRCADQSDASGPRSAEMVLDDGSVEAAVLETARGGIIRAGLGYDQADVAVVTNISADHLGADGIDDTDELTEVKALVAEEVRDGGSVVLNAADPAVAALADRPAISRRAPVIRYFSAVPGNPVIERHRRAGGICYLVRDGQLTEIAAGRQRGVLRVAELPGAFGGRAGHVVANALAAVAACRAVGVAVKDIREALREFTPTEANPGRGNVYAVGARPPAGAQAGPVIVDYGHNAAALHATGQMISSVWEGEPTAAITLPGDRRDDLTAESAEAIAAWFGRVVIYEDDDLRDRAPGEMRELIAAAIRTVRPDAQIAHAQGPCDALRGAVRMAAGGPVLFLYEKMAMASEALDALGATPWPEEDLMTALVSDPLLEDLAGELTRS